MAIPKTTLTFYGGVKEIGGNKILLDDNGTKIFLDFGMSFTKRGRYFEEFLKPRTANGLGDFIAMGLVPDIKGAYREDLLKHMGRKPEEPDIAAVILSHAHADHANYIAFLHKDIPVYCGETCKSILDAVEEQSGRDIESEVINFKPRPLFREDYRKPPIERKFVTFRTGDKVKIDNIEIEPIHVDHSVPGAYGFIIHTSSGAVIYTGDLRLHGNNPKMTHEFVEKASEAKPVAMIAEGTRIDIKHDDSSERTVYAHSHGEVTRAKGLAIADFNFKDVDRFRTFYTIARETGRKMVISFKHACYLERYAQDKSLQVPNVDDDNIVLLKPKVGTGTYDERDYSDAYIKDRLNYPNIVTAEYVCANPTKYLLVLNYWYFNQLIDLQPSDGSVYIHSLSEPFNEEMEISFARMGNWLRRFGLRFIQSHCSGHAPGDDLREVVSSIAPRVLFPVHTTHPGLFRGLSPVKLVREGRGYQI